MKHVKPATKVHIAKAQIDPTLLLDYVKCVLESGDLLGCLDVLKTPVQ